MRRRPSAAAPPRRARSRAAGYGPCCGHFTTWRCKKWTRLALHAAHGCRSPRPAPPRPPARPDSAPVDCAACRICGLELRGGRHAAEELEGSGACPPAAAAPPSPHAVAATICARQAPAAAQTPTPVHQRRGPGSSPCTTLHIARALQQRAPPRHAPRPPACTAAARDIAGRQQPRRRRRQPRTPLCATRPHTPLPPHLPGPPSPAHFFLAGAFLRTVPPRSCSPAASSACVANGGRSRRNRDQKLASYRCECTCAGGGGRACAAMGWRAVNAPAAPPGLPTSQSRCPGAPQPWRPGWSPWQSPVRTGQGP